KYFFFDPAQRGEEMSVEHHLTSHVNHNMHMALMSLVSAVLVLVCVSVPPSLCTASFTNRNIYGLEASFGDTGNYFHAFDVTKWDYDKPIPNTTATYIGRLGRFSNGGNGVDYVVRNYGLKLYNSLTL